LHCLSYSILCFVESVVLCWRLSWSTVCFCCRWREGNQSLGYQGKCNRYVHIPTSYVYYFLDSWV
jgi:hypothetical protein